MATDAPAITSPVRPGNGGISLLRLYVLRAMYLVLIVGVGAMIVPEILSHPLTSRGVIASLLGAVWLLAFLGLRYPLEMVPLLLFELAWKLLWMIFYGLPQWSAGELPPTFAEDSFNIAFGVVLLFVIPWPYVWRRFALAPAARWR